MKSPGFLYESSCSASLPRSTTSNYPRLETIQTRPPAGPRVASCTSTSRLLLGRLSAGQVKHATNSVSGGSDQDARPNLRWSVWQSCMRDRRLPPLEDAAREGLRPSWQRCLWIITPAGIHSVLVYLMPESLSKRPGKWRRYGRNEQSKCANKGVLILAGSSPPKNGVKTAALAE